MIDELVKVANAMDDANIVPINWHPKLKVLPKVTKKAPCVRVWLTDDGHVKDLESLSGELAAKLRKYEPENGKSLPGFNVRPLFRQVRSDEEMRQNRFEKMIVESLKQGSFDWSAYKRKEDDFWAKTRDGLKACFGRVREQIVDICKDSLDPEETLYKLLGAIDKIDIGTFQSEYATALQKRIEKGELPLSLLCYFVTETKKNKEDANPRAPVPKFSVFLDIADYKDYPVTHETTIARLNTLLSGSTEEAKTSIVKPVEQDAYGLDASQVGDKFPGVAIPLLGNVILRSQVKAIPAQMRYHRCESSTFPVGSATRMRTKAALEWISSPKHDGKTYGVAGEGELLFAYPRVLPEDKIPIAKMFGAQPDESLKGDKFERLAKSVIEQLKGLGKSTADAELEIFSLRKMDKARTKVVYYRNATVTLLERASQTWSEGCYNIPPLDMLNWSEEKDEKTGKSRPVAVENAVVFPIKLYRYLNPVWKRDGEQAGKTKIFEPADGLRLLLEEQCGAQAAHMMERFMQHAQGYFLSLCRATGRREIARLSDKIYYPGILGLLLFKSGKRKDEYMSGNAVLLGRFLRVADEIHRLYCEVVRENTLPPELCGSSLLVGMMESPGRTLDQLAMRSAPYVKWARAYHGEEKAGLVHYWMQRWSEVTDPLLEQGWPKRLSPDERAQVFLGYLASFPKSERTSNNNQTNSDRENKNE